MVLADILNMLLSRRLTSQHIKNMKKLLITMLLLTMRAAYGQGTLIVDQESTNLIEGGAILQTGQPLGQSFTPTFSSIGFVTLDLNDAGDLTQLGATVYINLRSNSITGPVLDSTTPVFMPNAFFGTTNFFFSTFVALTPGVMYYLEPIAEPGSDFWGWYGADASYTGGSEIYQGSPVPNHNLWFQEGIVIVPEPSTVALVLIGSGFALRCRRKNKLL
jgi:hypothetical protein